MKRMTIIPPIEDPTATPATCPEPICWGFAAAVETCTVDGSVLVGRDVLEDVLVLVDRAVSKTIG